MPRSALPEVKADGIFANTEIHEGGIEGLVQDVVERPADVEGEPAKVNRNQKMRANHIFLVTLSRVPGRLFFFRTPSRIPVPLSAELNSLATDTGGPPPPGFLHPWAIAAMSLACAGEVEGIS